MRRLVWTVIATVVFSLVLVFGASWYFSGQIHSGLAVEPLEHHDDVEIVKVSETKVTLAPTGEAAGLDTRYVYGLAYDGGFAHLTSLVADDGETVTRSYTVLVGEKPVAGGAADIRREAYPDQATQALGVPTREVRVASAGGAFPAWYTRGSRDTWAILVHGKGVSRAEMFRLMRTTTGLAMPSLDLTYRRDSENGGGLPTFGATEWPDLEAGVRYAVDHGAKQVVLVGCSMGAAIEVAFLEHSPLADRVAGLVFDAPMLDYSATIQQKSADTTVPALGTPVPTWLVSSAIQVADLRYDLDPDAMDYLDTTEWLTVPALVFHGTADATVPASVTERLAQAEPGLVTAVFVNGAGHVESWNADPDEYDATVRAFLAELP